MTCFLALRGPFLWRAVVNLFGKEELLKPIPASRRNVSLMSKFGEKVN
jgi:hypothetical protein